MTGHRNLVRHAAHAVTDESVGKLHEAIGRPVLTATSADQVALEGYKGHGVFTYAILDGLKNGDLNGNGLIEVSEISLHTQKLSPLLSTNLLTRGVRVIHSQEMEAVRAATLLCNNDAHASAWIKANKPVSVATPKSRRRRRMERQ